MSKLIRILLVEDDQEDYEITESLLTKIDDATTKVTWAENTQNAHNALKNESFDICLVDYYIGAETGMEFIKDAKHITPHMPFILLTGRGGHDIDIEAMHAGASDYLQKNGLSTEILERAIRYAITNADISRDLHNQSILLQATLDNAGSAIAAINREGKLIAWNDRLQSILKNYPNQTQDKPQSETLKLGTELKQYFPLFNTMPKEYSAPNGEIYEIHHNKLEDGGQVISFIDVTHRKKAEETLRKTAQDAEATSRAKSVFFANISHELRTPLNIIIGFAELLINAHTHDNNPNTKLDNYINHIYSAAQTLLRVIESTIDLTRMEAGNYPLTLDAVYVPFLLQKAVREIQDLAQKKSILVEIETQENTEDTLYIMGDTEALCKLLKHVLSNAVKFSPSEKNITIKAHHNHENIEIQIIDHGIGMHPEDIERAFSPFGQLDDSLAKRYSGIGLGLPIARALTLLHKGSITLESTPGTGTCATILLPAPMQEKDTTHIPHNTNQTENENAKPQHHIPMPENTPHQESNNR